MTENSFKRGITDGIPICLGYFAVSFAFGIFSYESGLTVWQTVLVSMTNVTSAGQLAAVPIMVGGGTLLELAASQLVINLRYSLMAVSISQKLDSRVNLLDRLIIAFVDTDEVFAVSTAKEGKVGKRYFFGLILTPWLGWSTGTLLGAVAGNVLPQAVISALGLAIYAMFIAIVVPPAKKSRPVAVCALIAIAFSCAFRYIPFLSGVPSGFVIIICAVIAGVVMALAAPLKEEEGGHAN